MDIFAKSPASFIGLSMPQISSMINKETINAVMGRASNATAEEQRTQLEREKQEGRNKSAHKSNDITMTPARTQRITNLISTTGEREQSSPKKTRSARKKDLLAFLGEGAHVQLPSMDGTPIEVAKMRRSPGSGILGTTKKRDILDSSNAIGRKKSKSDDEESLEKVANLEKMDEMPLKPKGSKSKPRKGSARKDKAAKTPDSGRKKATFAETVGKEVVKEKDIEYKKCVVGFAIQVNKTKDTKGGFDKKLNKGLAFMQTYIDQHASFHLINPGSAIKPIKEKGDFPKFQVTSRSYFCMPNAHVFDNINAEAGCTIKGSAVMGFTENPEQCLDKAAGNLRTMGCLIFHTKCQEVDTVSSQILIGVPNTIEEEVIKTTLDKELKKIEQTLLTTDRTYKLTKEQSKNWIRYVVVRDYPMGMPWEGI